jgi:predicted DNA-binding transcriptional regulator AlpA
LAFFKNIAPTILAGYIMGIAAARGNGELQMPDTASLAPDTMLTMQQVRQLIPLSHSQLYRMIKAGTFPRPVRLSPNRIAFSATTINQWLADRSS